MSARLPRANPVTFTVDADPDRRFEGRVTQVRLAAIELNNVVTSSSSAAKAPSRARAMRSSTAAQAEA